ncbi:MAG TPA: hypothetical protein VIY47_15835 [Ignavibacteriaceae bacterium]
MTYFKNYISGVTFRGETPAMKDMFDRKNIVIRKDFGDGGGIDGRYMRDVLVSIVDDLSGLCVAISGLKSANGGVTSSVSLRTLQTLVDP